MTEPAGGSPDPAPTRGLTRDQLHDIYYHIALAREAEERLEILFRQGRVSGGVYRSLGQEGGSVATAYALRRRSDGTGDIIGQTIRETGALFLMGGTPADYFRQYMARATGPTGGREANVHWCDFERGLLGPVSPLGTMVEVMAGITLSFRMRGEDRVGMVYGGDGATSTGAFHEGLNFAAVRRCPMVMVVEANQWAFSTPTRKQTRVESFVDKCPGYGIAGESVDGNDVLEVYEAARRAVDRARHGEGVTLLELRYYRRLGHAQHDPQDYVPREELELWAARDPLERFRALLLEQGWATSDEIETMDRRVEDEVRRAAEEVSEEPEPDSEAAGEDVLVGAPPVRHWTRLASPDPGAA